MRIIPGTITYPTLQEATESRYLAFRRAADKLAEAVEAGGELPAGADTTVLGPQVDVIGDLHRLAERWARLTGEKLAEAEIAREKGGLTVVIGEDDERSEYGPFTAAYLESVAEGYRHTLWGVFTAIQAIDGTHPATLQVRYQPVTNTRRLEVLAERGTFSSSFVATEVAA